MFLCRSVLSRTSGRGPAVALVAAVAVSGCSFVGADDADDDSGGQSALDPVWTQVELPREAMLPVDRVHIDAVLAGTPQLPHMAVGVQAEHGEPDGVRVWISEDAAAWEAVDVPLRDGAHATVADSFSDGTTTVLVGHTWTGDDGIRQPYALSSNDRRTWEEVALGNQARERVVDLCCGFVGADGELLILGSDRDDLPVAVRPGEDGEVLDLPEPEGGREFGAFAGVAANGDVVVAPAHAGPPGDPNQLVTYRSTDGGATWNLSAGSTTEVAAIAGVVYAGGSFVATGSVLVSNTSVPAAWSSPDGIAWAEDELPNATHYRQDAPRDLSEVDYDRWLGPPATDGAQVVVAHGDDSEVYSVVMGRDRSGVWSIRGVSENWIGPGISGLVTPLGDGRLLMSRSSRNSGIVGVIAADGTWDTSLAPVAANDPGLEWEMLGLEGGTPVLVGGTLTVRREGEYSWHRRTELSRFAYADDAVITEAGWDPPDSEALIGLAIVSDDAGATAVLGGRSLPGQNPDDTSQNDVVGWFRASPADAWAAAEGLVGPRTEYFNGAFWTGAGWIAVGTDAETSIVGAHRDAAVWVSTDGLNWVRQEGPFEVGPDLNSWASGACELPDGGGLLVVGGAESDAGRDVPVAWHQTDSGWVRVDQAALGGGVGSISSCALRDDTTVLQGRYDGRAVLWHTRDGEVFDIVDIGDRGEYFGTVHAVETGFVAAGSRTTDRVQGAVVWLSADAQEWHAIPVPSDRPLSGDDVLDWDGRLVVTTTSPGDPEVWVLENPAELLSQLDTDS